MKIKRPVTLACNKCEATFESSVYTVDAAREQAHKQGWSSSGSRVDHCPEHAGVTTRSRKVRKARKEAQVKIINLVRNEVVSDMHKKGISPADIATAVGVSRQRIYQILEEVGADVRGG